MISLLSAGGRTAAETNGSSFAGQFRHHHDAPGLIIMFSMLSTGRLWLSGTALLLDALILAAYTTSGACATPVAPVASRQHYPTSDPPLSERTDLRGNVSADRTLSARDLELVLELSAYLVDKGNRWSAREEAAEDLGRLGHRFAIPALLAVLRDENELAGVRQSCVLPLTNILHKQAVFHLIEDVLGSDSPDVVIDAHTWLAQMVEDGVELDLQWDLPRHLQPPQYDPAKQSRAEYNRDRTQWLIKRARFLQQEWRAWWKAHKDKPIDLNRTDRWIY
jgi:hypothetical protein